MKVNVVSKLKDPILALIKQRGFSVHGCGDSFADSRDARVDNTYFHTYHPQWHYVCGFKKDDGSRCEFTVPENKDKASFHFLLLEAQRKWPTTGPAVRRSRSGGTR